MTQNKECSVVLLPAEKLTNIMRDILTGELVYIKEKSKCLVGYYLYVLSDDEIKEGDWFMVDGTDYLGKCIGFENNNPKDINAEHAGCIKIIATTNPDLIKEGVASIDDEFIREYCNNPIDKVWVEYEINYDEIGESKISEAQFEFQKRHGYWLDIKSERKREAGIPSSFDYLFYNGYDDTDEEVIGFSYLEHTPHDSPYWIDLFVKRELIRSKPKLSSNGSIIIKPAVEDWDGIFTKIQKDNPSASGELIVQLLYELLNENYEPPTLKNK